MNPVPIVLAVLIGLAFGWGWAVAFYVASIILSAIVD